MYYVVFHATTTTTLLQQLQLLLLLLIGLLLLHSYAYMMINTIFKCLQINIYVSIYLYIYIYLYLYIANDTELGRAIWLSSKYIVFNILSNLAINFQFWQKGKLHHLRNSPYGQTVTVSSTLSGLCNEYNIVYCIRFPVE